MNTKKQKGFTLVELLVVIAIIGVLATLVLLQLGTARARARDTKRIADVSQLRTAAEEYLNDNGTYPAALSDATLGKYMSNGHVPTDPSTNAAYGYAYNPATNPTQYQIWTELEQKAAALASDSDINSTGWAGGNKIDGASEACTGTAGATDCIYDLGVQ